ncbi:YgaP-like transmembrane domain [Microvirga pudoricolor]|uniref:YgaP-like transmembrane domain n=1 Tax=Microvirga pudoricolor TaxID=2778729 RepID=UPI0019527D76|nr:YgaP-like transmembrane domain [Microvirga pudoricolor]MBM6596250.1 DUF2892 domain-containing protein [Microvirga pudoricolor]
MAQSDSGFFDGVFDDRPNLSTLERGAYIAVGLGLAAAAAKPRPNPLLNVLALAAGSYLAWRGAKGSCPVKAVFVGHDEPDRIADH